MLRASVRTAPIIVGMVQSPSKAEIAAAIEQCEPCPACGAGDGEPCPKPEAEAGGCCPYFDPVCVER
jgi:hypothetical protein